VRPSLCHRDDFVSAQIAFFGGSRTDQHGFIADSHMLGIGVRFRINGDGFDTHAACSSSDTAGDFAAIGDQDFGEHVSLSLFFGVADTSLSDRREHVLRRVSALFLK
jgi:hypothetical protein